jgi:peptidoglycan hydrolase-like protein with peptidoglycan-binding domain
MTGPDVTDWQRFLAGQGLLEGSPDGIFGPAAARATRTYQQNSGLAVDGVLGPATLARAVGDGFTAETRPLVAGMDASVDCSRFADRLAGAGMKFVARYYSNTAAKTLTPAEARKLSGAGLQLMVVFQDANNRVGVFTGARGINAATKALALAADIGQPAGSAIYFAVDFDPSPTEVRGPVSDYFHAAHQVLAAAPTRYAMGVYGSGLTCRLIRDAGLAKFTWLSGSSGFRESKIFRPQANVVQAAPDRDLFDGQLNIDDDIAQTSDFGTFRLGTRPPT